MHLLAAPFSHFARITFCWSTWAPVEGERAVMLHLRETDGRPAAFAVTSDEVKIRKVTVCDVTGRPVGGRDEAEFNPWESKFIKLSW